MTAKTLIVAAALLVSATSATLAQGYRYYGAPNVYGYAPNYGYSAAPYGYDLYRPRGGPGPRVGNGSGMGIGAER
jgi:hypothetical protein